MRAYVIPAFGLENLTLADREYLPRGVRARHPRQRHPRVVLPAGHQQVDLHTTVVPFPANELLARGGTYSLTCN